jgi:hypothetical protein
MNSVLTPIADSHVQCPQAPNFPNPDITLISAERQALGPLVYGPLFLCRNNANICLRSLILPFLMTHPVKTLPWESLNTQPFLIRHRETIRTAWYFIKCCHGNKDSWWGCMLSCVIALLKTWCKFYNICHVTSVIRCVCSFISLS